MTKKKTTTNGTITEIPKSLKIGPFNYTVEMIEENQLILEDDEEKVPDKPTYLLGKTSSHKQMIQIMAGMPFEVERETLFHEILHAIYTAVGGQDDDAPYVGEEKTIQMFSPAIVDVLDRNPELVAYMFGER